MERRTEVGFLDGLFKKGGISLGAPMKGTCVAITEVSDPTFGEEILGKGVAFKPTSGEVYAPADGVVNMVFQTGHAVSMTMDEGPEILIHVGLDTVRLNGLHFEVVAQENQKVKKGDLLIKADIEKIKEEGYDVITPMVICNTSEFASVEGIINQEVNPGDEVIKIKK